jgi:hypothetical protein
LVIEQYKIETNFSAGEGKYDKLRTSCVKGSNKYVYTQAAKMKGRNTLMLIGH